MAMRLFPLCLAALCSCAVCVPTQAQQAENTLGEVVVSATRGEQSRFDAPAAVDAVQVDPLRTASPLANLSELMSAVPGVEIRERQNYAQDLQMSIRGFGTRSTFGVRGIRILVDGIPATMPDGQGQLSSISLNSAKRIEVLRGPVAQLYGNASGGVVQVFSQDPPVSSRPVLAAGIGAGSDHQRGLDVSVGGGSETLGAIIDATRFRTDGYRDHSAAERNQLNAKLVARPSSATTITGIFNFLNQPLSQDPLGLSHADFRADPRQATPAALAFDTRKTVNQRQAGMVVEHQLSASDKLSARVYGGSRGVFQTLAIANNGVVDLDRSYGGAGLDWSHKSLVAGMPLQWTVGVEADRLQETRKGFANNNGVPGALRRFEDDNASNSDVFGQVSWAFAPDWEALAGLRLSRVDFNVGDHFLSDGNNSGSTSYRNTSPVLGAIWHANDRLNLYANIGTGFETPTLAEIAYSPNGAPGTNFGLQASKSVQAEFGVKARLQRHTLDLALFEARSRDEIVPQSNTGGRTVFQNADRVERRGIEALWKADWNPDWHPLATRIAYTLVDARFRSSFVNAGTSIPSGNRLPGTPQHSLFADAEMKIAEGATLALETRIESRTYVDDRNSDAAPGYAVFNLRAGKEIKAAAGNFYLYGRIDNLFDRLYAGSVIVNESNGRYFEPAPGRRFFIGLRTRF
jgi:iron complex outermembrane receptor protein